MGNPDSRTWDSGGNCLFNANQVVRRQVLKPHLLDPGGGAEAAERRIARCSFRCCGPVSGSGDTDFSKTAVGTTEESGSTSSAATSSSALGSLGSLSSASSASRCQYNIRKKCRTASVG